MQKHIQNYKTIKFDVIYIQSPPNFDRGENMTKIIGGRSDSESYNNGHRFDWFLGEMINQLALVKLLS